jgi:hypothetical protein
VKKTVNGQAMAAESSGGVRADGLPRGRPFPPGVSGNPGGKRKGLREFREALEAADAPNRMVQVLLRGLADEDVEIALAAYDRAAAYLYGRPGTVETESTSSPPRRITDEDLLEAQRTLEPDMTDDEARKFLEMRKEERRQRVLDLSRGDDE